MFYYFLFEVNEAGKQKCDIEKPISVAILSKMFASYSISSLN